MRQSGHKRREQATQGHGGYLIKKGQLVKSWKRRYFFLQHGCLNYFEDLKSFETNKKHSPVYDEKHRDLDSKAPFRAKGGMSLAGGVINIVDEGELKFDIITKERTLCLQAESTDDLLQWRTQLHLNIDLSNEDELFSGNINDESLIKWVANIGQIAAEAEHRLKEGRQFDKFCISSVFARVKSHPRVFKLSADRSKMCWYALGKGGALKKEKSIAMKDVSFVAPGLGFINAKKGVECLSLKFGNPMREICISASDENAREGFIADVWAIQYFEGLMRCQEKLGEIVAKKLTNNGRALHKVLQNAGR